MALPTQCQAWNDDDPMDVCGRRAEFVVTSKCEVCQGVDVTAECLECTANSVNAETDCTSCFIKGGGDNALTVTNLAVIKIST